MQSHSDQLAALASHMAERRTAIMDAWRGTVTADPHLTTGASLPRAQLHDHIPALLEDYERRLTAAGVACGPMAPPVFCTARSCTRPRGIHRRQARISLWD